MPNRRPGGILFHTCIIMHPRITEIHLRNCKSCQLNEPSHGLYFEPLMTTSLHYRHFYIDSPGQSIASSDASRSCQSDAAAPWGSGAMDGWVSDSDFWGTLLALSNWDV